MNVEITLGERIEEALHRLQEEQYGDEEEFYQLLQPYIKSIVRRYYMNPCKLDNTEAIEDITKDVMVDIFRLDIKNFEEKNGKFVTYCGVIAKNKTIDAMHWQVRHQTDSIEEESMEEKLGKSLYEKSAEAVVMSELTKLEIIERTKRYLQRLVELPEKPYRLVSSCFTLLLFHRYFPKTKELSSPGWAYDQLEESSVELGADRFIEEMNEWLP